MTKDFDFLPGKRLIAIEPHLDDKTLTTRIRISRDLRRYLRKSHFYLRYEQAIDTTQGVLSIPGVALLLPLAWLTGSDLHVRCLDRRFAKAAEALQRSYQAMYPKMPFGTKLIVDELVDSPPNPEASAMLFSGGLDATYTFFANRHLKPRLVQVFGTEFPVSHTKYLNWVKQESSDFARKHGVEISFVYTNFSFLFDLRAINYVFPRVRERVSGDLWKGMGYSLGFLAMTAPLSLGRFNHLIIAAWANKEHADRMRENPDSSSPKIDQQVAWANLRVEHHGCLHRFEKARAMKDWLPGNNLRVCWMASNVNEAANSMNCSRCEKCQRSMVALAIGGADPTQCGFRIDENTGKAIIARLTHRRPKNSHLAFWWGPMQRELPDAIEDDMFGLSEFMKWFQTCDLGNGLDPKPPLLSFDRLYAMFPYPVSRTARTLVYRVIGEPHWMNLDEEE